MKQVLKDECVSTDTSIRETEESQERLVDKSRTMWQMLHARGAWEEENFPGGDKAKKCYACPCACRATNTPSLFTALQQPSVDRIVSP